MTQIKFIIDQHSLFVTNNVYTIIDPELKLYNVNVFGKERTQYEIINSLSETNEYDCVDFNYNNKIEMRYQFENDKINLIPLNIDSVHLIRLIGIKKIPQYNLELDIQFKLGELPDILFEIDLVLNRLNQFEYTDYCTICGNILNIIGFRKIQCCKNKDCISLGKIKVLDNIITNAFNKDPNLTEFLITILVVGSSHPKEEKIFKPLPDLPKINNLTEFKKLLGIEVEKDNLNPKHIIESKTDIDLYRKIGFNAYGIIINAISNNYFSMSTVNIEKELFNHSIVRLSMNNENNLNGIKTICLNYSYEIENSFTTKNFLFHGAPLYSWYPIVKNGLKVMSGTEFQANGSAYGSGIYFSDSFQFSLSYSNRTISKPYSNIQIVGVFEINDEIDKYKKSTSIFVINNDQIILLRYLIIVDTTINKSTNYNEISEYFVKYKKGINKSNEKKISNIKNKRFNGEIKLLNKNPNVFDVEIIDEIKYWIIKLKNIKDKIIKLQVYFNDYPRLPPKIIIDSNINSTHEDLDNLILSELSPSKWDITLNLSTIVDKICNFISNII